METYNLKVNNKEKEANTIKQILYNNKYNPPLFTKLTPLTNNTKSELNKIKWTKFTYVDKEKNSLLNFSNILLMSPSKHKTL
jgi:hypothetical protein